ncbi:MAG: hypothetical protein BWK80_04960 [Desulfobacteraceae bacterium IS3]|nr:MAG: hypothetical protein BWK80_04960 [Desulfobacteraceae bacterium IS3]
MLKQIKIKGYKSLKDQEIDLSRINVLIGPNGGGKSNLISFFKMINFMLSENLQLYIARSGGADSLLFYTSKTTLQIESTLTFETDAGFNTHYMRLVHAAQDTLIFADERVSFSQKGRPPETAPKTFFGAGHKESGLINPPESNDTHRVMQRLMNQCRYFQFHDTSETAGIKQNSYVEDNRYLRSDAGNLAAFLYTLRETATPYYDRIISILRQVMPFFDNFVLERSRFNSNQIMLNWKEKNSDIMMGPHLLSDGSLRMMALVSLLFQPEKSLPDVILIDEPELGLHPYAIGILVSLIRYASNYTQIIIATQSAELMDYFEPDEIIITERPEKESFFKRLDSENLREWREDYSMSELWKKNVIGGSPLQ